MGKVGRGAALQEKGVGVQPANAATAANAMSTLHCPAWAPERGSSIAQRGRSARAT